MKVTAIVRYKNGVFYEARKAAGLSQSRLAQFCGVDVQRITDYENFRDIPSNPDVVRQLEIALGKSFEDLFPAEYKKAVSMNVPIYVERSYEVTMVMLEGVARSNLFLPSAEDEFIEMETSDINKKRFIAAVESLSGRESYIIKNRLFPQFFGEAGKTYASIAEDLKLSRERVRQLEAKAVRHLRNMVRRLEFVSEEAK